MQKSASIQPRTSLSKLHVSKFTCNTCKESDFTCKSLTKGRTYALVDLKHVLTPDDRKGRKFGRRVVVRRGAELRYILLT